MPRPVSAKPPTKRPLSAGQKKNAPALADDMYDEVDVHHRARQARLIDDDEEDGDDDVMNAEPVLDLPDSEEDDDADDDDEEDDDEDPSDDDAEASRAARAREERMLSAWGKQRGAYHGGDADVEIDDDAAAEEEAEALRLQRKRAQALDEDDVAFGYVATAAPKSAAAGGSSKKAPQNTPSRSAAASTAADTIASAIRRPAAAGAASASKSGAKKAPAAAPAALDDSAALAALERAMSGPSSAGAAAAGHATAAGGSEKVAKRLSSMSRQEKLDAVVSDAPELLGLLEDMQARVAEVRGQLEPILAAVAEGRLATGGGVSFLEAKHAVLCAYVSSIAFYLLLKAEGRPVRDHPVMADLVHCRALLEKMRPLDARMQHSIARLLRAAAAKQTRPDASGAVQDDDEEAGGDVDAEAARPMPSALLKHGDSLPAAAALARRKGGAGAGDAAGGRAGKVKPQFVVENDDDDEEEAEGGDGAEGSGGIFQPLRRSAVRYDADNPKAARAAREATRRADRLSRSTLLSELKTAYGEAPEEEDAEGGAGGAGARTGVDDALDRVASERAEYEEDMFTRVAVGKDERKARKARERERARWDALGELENFGDLQAQLQAAEAAAGGGAVPGAGRKGARSLEDVASSGARMASSVRAAVASGLGLDGKAGRAREATAGLRLSSAPSRGRFDNEDDDDDDDGPAARRVGKKAGRRGGDDDDGDDDEEGGGGGVSEDPFYAAVVAAAERKKARKAAAAATAQDSDSRFRRQAAEDEGDTGPVAAHSADSGDVMHRKASKAVLANRGLVKYRNREMSNPRVANRIKAAKFVKRRSGQVAPMRNKGGAEAGAYGGEASGIRTTISRSRKIA